MNIDLSPRILSLPILHTMCAGALLGLKNEEFFSSWGYFSWLIWIPIVAYYGYRWAALIMICLFPIAFSLTHFFAA